MSGLIIHPAASAPVSPKVASAKDAAKIKKALQQVHAPVPAGMCAYLEYAMPPQLGAFAFKLVSHLLANLDPGSKFGPDYPRVTRANLKILGGPKNDVFLTQAIAAMLDATIVKVFGGGFKAPNHYTLTDHMREMAAKHDDKRVFASFEGYQKRVPYVAKPVRGISRDIRARYPERAVDEVRKMQGRHLNFDRGRCLSDLSNQTLSLVERKLILRSANKLHDSKNYTQYRLAESGRLQSFGASNLQGIPGVMRHWFYPDPGYIFMDVDYKTQEITLLGHLSNDLALQRDVANHKEDIYEQAGDHIKVPRAIAKAMVNAFLYGASSHTLAELAGCLGKGEDMTHWSQLREARKLKSWMEKRYPVAMYWIEHQVSEIQRGGWAYGYDGFARRIPAVDARATGVNHVVQATAAAILQVVLVDLGDQLGDLGHVLVPFYDGLLLQVREDDYGDAARIVRSVMGHAPRAVPQSLKFSGQGMNGLFLDIKIKKGWFKGSTPPAGANAIP